MRPYSGNCTAAASVAARTPGRRAEKSPRITLGEKFAAGADSADGALAAGTRSRGATFSGMRITSSARARWWRRRRKPRSSNAEISRWMPDFDLRLSASFISSKLGEKPVCLR